MTDAPYVVLPRHRPQLAAGGYTLTATLDVALPGAERERRTVDLYVAGERYSLGPTEVHAVYPPEGSRGQHQSTLPHVTLRRDTLPWERTADGAGAPWLALLILGPEQAERSPLRTTTLAAYRRALGRPLPVEPGESDDDCVQVVDLDDTLRAHLPALSELAMLTHVRGYQSGQELTDGVAVVVSKNAPVVGRNVAHLVSLEHRFPGPIDAAPVISLFSWTFHCEAGATPALGRLFARLDAGWLRVPGAPDHPAAPYISRGRTPLPHRARSGESGVSWYSGPLVPGAAVDDPALVTLPANSADALVWCHEDIGMLDVTYAAAWELGRLLAIEHREVAAALASWRRDHVIAARQRDVDADLRYLYLPQMQRALAQPLAAPAVLVEWIRGLWRLDGIPFKYLVPDERMLPAESIRFFSVSARWMDALLDGVLSLARFGDRAGVTSPAVVAALIERTERPAQLTGFLLRSEIVAGWPDLEAEALDAQGGRLARHPSDPLSPSILMGLFEGRAARIVLRQHRHTAHFERTAVDPRPRNPLISRDPDLPDLGPDPLGGGPRPGPQMSAPHLSPLQVLELELDWGA